MPYEFRKRVAEIALAEWWFFGGQYRKIETGGSPIDVISGAHGTRGTEKMPGFKQRTWTYFKSGVFQDDDTWKKFKQEPWSAAFISFCMRLAGAEDAFPYHPAHSYFVSEAVRNRIEGNLTGSLVAYDVDEMTPRIGDLLWFGTGKTSDWNFKRLVKEVDCGIGFFPSHTGIVAEVNSRKKRAFVVGGNVADTVLRTTVRLKDSGLLKTKRFKAVIKVNI